VYQGDPFTLIDYAWVCWENATNVKKWRIDNPGEAARLDKFVLEGGDAPMLMTATGQALVATWQARTAAAHLRNSQA
jgi:hypothetical protein